MTEGKDQRKEERVGIPEEQEKPKAPDWLIDNIAEASKNARKIYFLYVGLLAYCALTVVSTSDRQIILNDTARLPIVDLDVSLNGFFLLAPLIMILVFIYFQLYLHRLKGLIDDLRAHYEPVENRRLYPWMVNIAEDPEPGGIGKLQRIMVSFSLWNSLTLVLLLFAIWHVKKHEPAWSYVVGSSPIIGSLISLWFWMKYEPDKLRESAWRKTFLSIGFVTVITFQLCLFLLLIPWAREGGGYQKIRPFICVDLSYQKLITEPDKDKDYKGLYWGNLSKAHLEGARLVNTVLKRADLHEANLQKADLYKAVLEKANLMRANLQEAYLIEANLQGANLREANLQEVYLLGANLQGAGLWGANLQGADLQDANLHGADLLLADLRGAKELAVEGLSQVKTLYRAKLDPELLEQIKEQYPHLLELPTALTSDRNP